MVVLTGKSEKEKEMERNLFKGLLLLLLSSILFFGLVSFGFAEYLISDFQDGFSIAKYKLDLDGGIVEVGPEGMERKNDTVRLMYDIGYLVGGKHVIKAKAGNERDEWSEWSETFIFYLGVPTPQTISLYCVGEEPTRIPRENWKVYYVSSYEPSKSGSLAFDGDENTQWHSSWTTTDPATKHPHEIQIELGKQYTISGFYILPRQDGNWNGTILRYKFYVSPDGTEWIEVASGKLLKVREEQFVEFSPVVAKYISLVALSEVNGGPWATVAELNVLGY